MKQRTSRHRLVLVLVALFGVALLAIEVYHLSPPIRLEAVALRERIGASDSLVRMLSDSDPHVQLAASNSLFRLGPTAVPGLIRGTRHPDGNARAFALATLSRIGTDARDALPAIGELACDDPEGLVREAAIRALAAVGGNDPNAVATLASILASGDDTGRMTAAEALGQLGRRAEQAVPALVRALGDPVVGVRREVAEALGAMGPVAAPAVPALISALGDSSPDVRAEAAEALGSVGRAARSAVPSLIAALGDTHPKVRSEAAEALEKMAMNWGEGDLPLRDRALESLKISRSSAP